MTPVPYRRPDRSELTGGGITTIISYWLTSQRTRRHDADPAGYMEEIHSMKYLGRNAGSFALEIVAIADWGQKFMDVGLNYPVPTFPQYLFTCSPHCLSHARVGPKSPSSHLS